MATGKVRYDSDLERHQWLNGNLGIKAKESFWAPFKGSSSQDIIYKVQDLTCGNGTTVVFDYSGELSGSGVKGSGDVSVSGETKNKFSDTLKVHMYSWFVNNGTKFDGCRIGDLNISQHSDSVDKLGELWIKHRDQAIFDTFQGATGCGPSHIYNLGCSFEWNDLNHIELAAKKGDNLVRSENGLISTNSAIKRGPLKPFKIKDGRNVYLAVIDSTMSVRLRSNPSYQAIIMNADTRGNENALISGVIGYMSNVLYVEAPSFMGRTKGDGPFNVIEDTEISSSGLRRYAVGEQGTQIWEGQAGFDEIEEAAKAEKAAIAELTDPEEIAEAEKNRKNRVYSRGLLLGANAGREGFGKQGEYVLETTMFKKSSISMLELVWGFGKTNLTLESGKDNPGKITELDYGVIALDMEN